MKTTIGIVASLFNKSFVDGLIDSALVQLKGQRVDVVRVPGSFEIPLATQRLLARSDVGAVIAFGVIWQGQTAHADLIGQTVTGSLMDLMLKHDKPVIHQVLVVKNEAQARARCFGKKLNRGSEAAQAVKLLLNLKK
ncbi:MAG: 6,7-dimethyl-8-ribityllumazine synthase [Candidatus Methylacidiphilales bacterium]|nr:6,7-dimethyl-8-ribityllumazine synthase [Candidatus Methylacidiphilales bacterium]